MTNSLFYFYYEYVDDIYLKRMFLKKRPRAKTAGFTLIELLIVIAVIGVLAAVILVVVNPLAQLQRARDAGRQSDIRQITTAVESYMTVFSSYPPEGVCDSSLGSDLLVCLPAAPGSNWDTTSTFYTALVNGGFLKRLPVDPVNTTSFFYQWEPDANGYWIGGKLERPANASLSVFRCSDRQSIGPGCRDVSNYGQ